jgi:hypothetical protein
MIWAFRAFKQIEKKSENDESNIGRFSEMSMHMANYGRSDNNSHALSDTHQ